MEHVRYPELHVGPAAAARVSCTPIEGAPERPPGAEKVLELEAANGAKISVFRPRR